MSGGSRATTHGLHAPGSQEMVASIVVLPLIFDGVTFGGFYVTLETTSNFQNIKDLLMGLVNSVVLLLAKRLQPQRDQIWESILSVGGGLAGGLAELGMGCARSRRRFVKTRCPCPVERG